MIVALHTPPLGFFNTEPPHSNDELLRFAHKAASMGFKAVQIGPLSDYAPIDGEHLREALGALGLETNVHVGGLHDAKKMALSSEECDAAKKQIHDGIVLCQELSSTLVSVHPPFFETMIEASDETISRTKTRFFDLLKDEVDFASRNGISVALESFCYPPFIFEGLEDFARFVCEFRSNRLGVLLDAGHVYQMGIDLEETIRAFGDKLLDVHVHDAMRNEDFRRATHLPVGKGNIHFISLLSVLREASYDGWLTLEVRGTEKEIVKSREHLERLIKNFI